MTYAFHCKTVDSAASDSNKHGKGNMYIDNMYHCLSTVSNTVDSAARAQLIQGMYCCMAAKYWWCLWQVTHYLWQVFIIWLNYMTCQERCYFLLSCIIVFCITMWANECMILPTTVQSTSLASIGNRAPKTRHLFYNMSHAASYSYTSKWRWLEVSYTHYLTHQCK